MKASSTIGALTATRVVCLKEIKDGVRDWRSLASALLFPVFGPGMIFVMYLLLVTTMKDPGQMTLPVVGQQHAPELVDWLAQHNIVVEPAPDNPRLAVKNGDIDVALVVPEDFGEKLAQSQSIIIEMIVDDSRNSAQSKTRKVERAVNSFGRQIGVLRLLARGIDPTIAAPLVVRKNNVVSNQAIAAKILNMIPLFVIMAAFVCGMQIAMDATAGERERGSLEPLLTNPVARSAIVLGKWLAAVLFAVVGVLLTMFGSMIALQSLPLEEIGLRFNLGWVEILGLLAAVLPMALLAPALQMLIASFARSYKEAQTYISMLIFLPMAPSIYGSMLTIKSQPWMFPVPALGQQVIISDVMSGTTPHFATFLAAGLSSLFVALLCVYFTSRLFQKETIIFGR